MSGSVNGRSEARLSDEREGSFGCTGWMRAAVFLLPVGLAFWSVAGCVNRKLALKPGAQSFVMQISVPENQRGTAVEPLPFAATKTPLEFDLSIQAIAWNGQPDSSFTGTVFLDAQPGIIKPDRVNVVNGKSTITVELSQAYGRTRIWAEDCGRRLPPLRNDCTPEEFADFRADCISRFEPGSLASGVTPALYFEDPAVHEVQGTTDSFTSPLVASIADRCSALADPRYADVSDIPLRDQSFLPRGQIPPRAGNVVSIRRGQMIVTSIDNSGFYVTDVCPPTGANDGTCGPPEFNHLFVFNFNYPEGLRVGDRLLELKGTPTEFSGSTQLTNPSWRRDRNGPYPERVPAPTYLSPDFYGANIRPGGAQSSDALGLEKLEGALVCVDGLELPARYEACDKNRDGFTSRSGKFCKLLNPDLNTGSLPCTDLSVNNSQLIDTSVPCQSEPFEGSLFVRDNADEYCCELACYEDSTCTERSSFDAFQQFALTLPLGQGATKRNKVAVTMVNALPGFEPIAFGDKFVAANPDKPVPSLRITGNLVNVTGGRPVWLIKPRGAEDVGYGDTCADPVRPTRGVQNDPVAAATQVAKKMKATRAAAARRQGE